MSSLHPIIVVHRSTRSATILRQWPDAEIIDVTSKGPPPWQRFSPFYPHGGVPVPFSPGVTSQSVEGVWQGLKVFEGTDIDTRAFAITTMQGLKRTQRRFGPTLGHRAGVGGQELLSYLEARRLIYLPSYLWVLEHRLGAELQALSALAWTRPLVLLDYESNTDVMNASKPLSHAALVRAYLLSDWPHMPSPEATP
jgi:hypothetical protein